tara:strand:- start:2326 stop:2826 length:501 start_codon:yes stop_codon:yes gene_type:complete
VRRRAGLSDCRHRSSAANLRLFRDVSYVARVRSLSEQTITTLLADLAQPVRLASQSPNGFPLISTLWFLYADGAFWCITQSRTLMRRNLAANPRCAFEITLQGQAYKLVRGQGIATLHLDEGERLTNLMIARYLRDPQGPVAQKLRAQIPTEYGIRIRPRWVRGSK